MKSWYTIPWAGKIVTAVSAHNPPESAVPSQYRRAHCSVESACGLRRYAAHPASRTALSRAMAASQPTSAVPSTCPQRT